MRGDQALLLQVLNKPEVWSRLFISFRYEMIVTVYHSPPPVVVWMQFIFELFWAENADAFRRWR